MRLGLGSYTYTWAVGVPGYESSSPSLSPDGLLDKAAAFGCEVVQLCDNIAPESLSAADAAALGRRAAAMGIGLQVGTRGVEPDHLRCFLALATRTGSDLVRSMLPKTGIGADVHEAAAMLSAVMPEFEKAGVLLSIENHDRHRCRELRWLVERAASPNLGICLDTVNSFGAAEDPSRVMDTLLPLANCLHIKDFTIQRVEHQMGFVVVGAPAGEGMLDIEQALTGFPDPGGRGAVILESWTPFQGSAAASIELEDDWAKRGMTHLLPLVRGAVGQKKEKA